MKKYVAVYIALLRLNFAVLVAYRANFINSVISSVGWGVFSIVLILLLTAKTQRIQSWSREEIILLTALYNVFIGAFHMLFSSNFERFAKVIHLGQLDSLLVKPLDSQFLLSFWLFNYTSLFRVFLGIIVSFYMMGLTHADVHVFSILILVLLGITGLFLMYSIWYIFLTVTIWFTKLYNIVDLLYQINSVTRYPPEMFTKVKSFIVLILFPLTLVIAAPAKSVLNRLTLSDVSLLIFSAMSLLLFSRVFWKFALRYYTSASG